MTSTTHPLKRRAAALALAAAGLLAGCASPVPADYANQTPVLDPCIGWDDSVGVLQTLSAGVLARRKH